MQVNQVAVITRAHSQFEVGDIILLHSQGMTSDSFWYCKSIESHTPLNVLVMVCDFEIIGEL